MSDFSSFSLLLCCASPHAPARLFVTKPGFRPPPIPCTDDPSLSLPTSSGHGSSSTRQSLTMTNQLLFVCHTCANVKLLITQAYSPYDVLFQFIRSVVDPFISRFFQQWSCRNHKRNFACVEISVSSVPCVYLTTPKQRTIRFAHPHVE